jgi:hypothetical protein
MGNAQQSLNANTFNSFHAQNALNLRRSARGEFSATPNKVIDPLASC